MKDDLYDKQEFATKELEVNEPKNKWGYPTLNDRERLLGITNQSILKRGEWDKNPLE